MYYPIDSNTCIEVTSRGVDSSCQFKNNLVLGSHYTVWKAVGHTVNGIGLDWLFLQLNTLGLAE
jgi:hypothetical protein